MLKNNRGFTLIELVMVIVLLGILAAIAVPRFVDLQGEARLAVLDASVGAVRSAAIIQFARTKNANSLATIIANTDLDAKVTLSGGSTCANAALGHTDGGSRPFSLISVYCAG